MDTPTAAKLRALTRDLYDQAALSFSDTRASAWPGWQRVLDAWPGWQRDTQRACPEHPIRVLDIACGNLRFERFLAEAAPDAVFDAHCVDACTSLACDAALNVPDNVCIHFHPTDVLEALEASETVTPHDAAHRPCQTVTPSPFRATPPETLFDICVAFGFMHHIPLPAWRAQLLQALVNRTREGGMIAVSFWQFLHDARLAEKAADVTRCGCQRHNLVFDDAHDKLLSWQDRADLFRYCHHFSDDEVDQLVTGVSGARVLGRFNADGRAALNRYVVLQRTGAGQSDTSVRYASSPSSS